MRRVLPLRSSILNPRSSRLLLLLLALAALAAGGYASWRWRAKAQLLCRGEEALAGREYAKAHDYLARYLSLQPGDSRARLLAARVARRMKHYDEAEEQLRRCRKDGGVTEAVAVEYSLLDVQRGQEGSVAALRERALVEDELALVILEVLVQYDLDTDRLRQAQQDLTLYLSRRPTDLQALLGRGSVWERLFSFADARDDYRKAVVAHPDSERARLRLADALLITGTPAEALEHYQWLAARSPARLEVRLGLARCRRRLGNLEESRQLLEALLAESPGYAEALWERGQVELDRDQPSEAEPWLRRAVQARPFDRRIAYTLSRCLLELDHPEEAEALTARVAQLDADVRRLAQVQQEVMQRPNDATLRCEGGLLFLRNGERREGTRWLQMALRLDPHCEAALAALAKDGSADSHQSP
jgi:tetratricopeptide (TPR) repeat protein